MTATKMCTFHVVDSPRMAGAGFSQRLMQIIRKRITESGWGGAVHLHDSLDDALACVERELPEEGSPHVISELTSPCLDLGVIEDILCTPGIEKFFGIRPEGMTPGTEFLVAFPGRIRDASLVQGSEWLRFRIHPSRKLPIQVDVRKFKRLKMLFALEDHYPTVLTMSVESMATAFTEGPLLEFLLAYAQPDVSLREIESCPLCSGVLVPLERSASHPFIGFIPLNVWLYGECRGCGLVSSLHMPDIDSIPSLYDEFDFLDFQMTSSTGDPYGPSSARCDFSTIKGELPSHGVALDLGGGTGRFATWLAQSWSSWKVLSSDFSTKSLERETSGIVKSVALDLNRDHIGIEEYDLITAWEVIEHIHPSRLEDFLDRVWKALKPGGFFLFSTPDLASSECMTADFWAACFPFHLTVMSEPWIRQWISGSSYWEYGAPRWNNDLFDDWSGWTSYLEYVAPNISTVGFARSVSRVIAEDPSAPSHRISGSEVVITLRRRKQT